MTSFRGAFLPHLSLRPNRRAVPVVENFVLGIFYVFYGRRLDCVLYEYIFAELHHPGFGCAGVRNVFGSAQARMNLCATAGATGLTLISSLISRRGDSKVSNEIKIFFRFCPYQHFRIFLFLFSLLLVFSSVLISSLLLTRWKLVLFHFDSSASSFHRKSSVCAAVVSRELLSKKKIIY